MSTRAVDPRGMVPPFRQIAAWLSEDIKTGVYAAGSAIPSESALAETYGVARGTIRSALQVLRDSGEIETVVGRGSYVSTRDPSA